MNEKELKNVSGGVWLFDVMVSWICLVGTRTFGNNRVEPESPPNTDGFILVEELRPNEGKPVKEGFYYVIR